MATEHPISVVASEFNYIVVFLHGITLGYPTQKLLTFILPLLAKISISCKCRKYRGRKCDVLISYTSKGEKTSPLLWYYGSGGDEKFVFQVVLFINIAKVEKE